MVLDDIRVQPIRDKSRVDGPRHPIHLVARQTLGLDQEDCQKLGIDISSLPELVGQRWVGLDLRRNLPNVTVLDAELIVPGAPLPVLLTDLLVAESFELRKSILECHGHVCLDPCGGASNSFPSRSRLSGPFL